MADSRAPRNVSIHGYAAIDDAIVWQLATERLPGLIQLLTEQSGDR